MCVCVRQRERKDNKNSEAQKATDYTRECNLCMSCMSVDGCVDVAAEVTVHAASKWIIALWTESGVESWILIGTRIRCRGCVRARCLSVHVYDATHNRVCGGHVGVQVLLNCNSSNV